jgi:uncharacterized membrane protein YfcA
MIELSLFLAGILAGITNAVAGGGVLFVFPVLLLAGLNPQSAAMTSTFAGWPGALTAIYGYRKDLRKARRFYFWLLIPCIIGAGIGSILLVHTPSSTFEVIVPWLVLASVALFAFQPQLHRHIHRPAHMRSTSPFFLLVCILFPTSIYAGYFGAGFGFIVLAVLSFTKLKNVYQINGMKNMIGAAISITCVIVFVLKGGIAWEFAPFPFMGSLIGGFVGTRLAHHLSPHTTRAAVVSSGVVIVSALFTNVL